MNKVYTHFQLETLSEQLAGHMKNANIGVFGKQYIVTQSPGMNAWLRTELANRLGILTQVEFINPDGLFLLIYKSLIGEKLNLSIDNLRYNIYKLLAVDEFVDQFQTVSNYYQSDDKRRFDLASKIADLFDQYQLYRPEMLTAWADNLLTTNNEAENWQKWLWNKLQIKVKKDLANEIIQSLPENKEKIQKLFPYISFFGISIYTQFHLDFFKKISEYTQITTYLCLPVHNDQIGKTFNNELLKVFGNKANELILQFDNQGVEFIHIDEEATYPGNHYLNSLQKNILDNALEKPSADTDHTIQINSCHSLVREAECLYNFLLDNFDKDRSLRPRDVLVITTDIDKYAPFIKAVFRNAPVNIPIKISGASNNSSENTVSTLEQILAMTSEDFTSEKVVSLLEQKRIKKRYQVADTGYIRSVVNKANIRFGLVNSVEDETCYVSWKYGLDKIILGYAMLPDDEDFEFDGKVPFRDAEAGKSHDLLRLKKFVEDLAEIVKHTENSYSLAEWKRYVLEEVIDKIIFVDDFNKDDRTEMSYIFKSLSFIDRIENADTLEVPFNVFLTELRNKLFKDTCEMKLNTGSVTVSSAVPVRGLPYKIICFIGLDNGVFPRRDRFAGFDLLGEAYTIGDRSKKETDKYLFLDTLLAARNCIYFSYIGQSLKDNTPIPPSIVLDALMNYTPYKPCQHPLHGFSAKYQAADERLFTYLYAPVNVNFNQLTAQNQNHTDLTVNSLLKFFENPIRWYFNQVMDIYYEESDDTLPETEMFEMNNLEKWFVKSDFLNSDLSEDNFEKYIQKQIREGKIPLKNLGKYHVEKIMDEIADLKTNFTNLVAGRTPKTVLINLTIGDYHIHGEIPGIYENDFIDFTFSKDTNKKNRIKSNLKILLLCAQNEVGMGCFLIKKNSIQLTVLTPEAAREFLANLCTYISEGCKTPLKFHLDVAKKVNEKEFNVQKMKNEFYSCAYPYSEDDIFPDLYVRKLFEQDYFEDLNQSDLDKIKVLKDLLNVQLPKN